MESHLSKDGEVGVHVMLDNTWMEDMASHVSISKIEKWGVHVVLDITWDGGDGITCIHK